MTTSQNTKRLPADVLLPGEENALGKAMIERERRDAKTLAPRGTFYPDMMTKRITLREPLPCDARNHAKKLSAQQKEIVSFLTTKGPATVTAVSQGTGMNANSVAANMSALANVNLIVKLHTIRKNGKTVAAGRRDCWVYGAASAQKEG